MPLKVVFPKILKTYIRLTINKRTNEDPKLNINLFEGGEPTYFLKRIRIGA